MIVGDALLLDRVANSNLNPEGLCGSYVHSSRRRVGAQEIGALWCFHFSVRRQARKTEKTKDVALVTDQSPKQPAKSCNKPLLRETSSSQHVANEAGTRCVPC